MSRRDIYHDAVCNGLIKDGWSITHDPLRLPFGRRNVRIDLGAEAPVGAEKEGRKIAVEIKSFLHLSELTDLERTFGQMLIYTYVLENEEPDRMLYLAVADKTFATVFNDVATLDLIERMQYRMLIFNVEQEVITRWIE
jgi:hypothetical protein